MTHGRRISVIGLGYVGLPVALAFARQGTLGAAFDIDEERVAELKAGRDRTGEADPATLPLLAPHAATDPAILERADFHIVTVPTPIDSVKAPDLGPLRAASRTVGRRLRPGAIVVYESTVYPGCVMEECVPLLAAESGLAFGRDFTVGYSPERINPGDSRHRLENVVKVVSGSDAATLDVVAAVYGSIVPAGIHRASAIAVAEAAKVIENTQRDLNIALMNELSMIFGRLGIDTGEVLAAAGTKWNFLKFRPGLVGGHCIGVDPYYLTHKAAAVGHHAQVILAGREINDGMGRHVAGQVIRALMRAGVTAAPVVTILGLTFKENVPDIRNTRVADIAATLADHGLAVQVHDPLADPAEVARENGLALTPLDALRPADAVVLAVGHDVYRGAGWPLIRRALKDGRGFVADVQGILPRPAPDGITLWRL